MKKKSFEIVVSIMALGILAAGCGKNRNGTYTGQETVNMNGQSQQSSVTLTLSNSDGDRISGTWISNTGSGNFSGDLNGDSITNVRLEIANTGYNQTGYNQTGYNGYNQTGYNTASQGCGTVSTGTLIMTDDNKITGTLSAIQTQPANQNTNDPNNQNYQQYGNGYGCNVTRTVDLNKAGES